MSENLIERQLKTLIELSSNLNTVLNAERRSLAERDLQALAQATEEKTAVCRQIDTAVADLGPTPLSEQLAAQDPGLQRVLRPLHEKLTELAEVNRDYNAANGKILHRSQQSVRELISLLSGAEAEPLYEPSGQTAARSHGSAIAKA